MSDQLLVMSLPRKLIDIRILGFEPPINKNLVKLFAFHFPSEQRRLFRRELRGWFRDLQQLRFKPDNRTGSVKFYYNRLFDYPFGGVEAQNVKLIMQSITEEYPDAAAVKLPEEVAGLLQAFHRRLAEGLHAGQPVLDLVPK